MESKLANLTVEKLELLTAEQLVDPMALLMESW